MSVVDHEPAFEEAGTGVQHRCGIGVRVVCLEQRPRCRPPAVSAAGRVMRKT
jgi:hypothetical protein